MLNNVQTGDFGVAAQLTRTMSKRNTVFLTVFLLLLHIPKFKKLHIDVTNKMKCR